VLVVVVLEIGTKWWRVTAQVAEDYFVFLRVANTTVIP
jgi:hypothetical protein